MLNAISSRGFESLREIESLDLRGTELREYPVKMLQSLSSLQVIFSDVYKKSRPYGMGVAAFCTYVSSSILHVGTR